jgi:hypothetical protein
LIARVFREGVERVDVLDVVERDFAEDEACGVGVHV